MPLCNLYDILSVIDLEDSLMDEFLLIAISQNNNIN